MDRFNPAAIRQGNQARMEAEERPSTFATYNGEADVIPDTSLARSNNVRKAGPMGQHALELMTDPVAAKQTANWMKLFGKSNQGAMFYQAANEQASMGADQ